MPFTKLLKTSFQHILRNKGLAFASVIVMTLTFLISSAFGAAFYTSTNILDYVDKKIPVIVFVDNNASSDEIKHISDTIKSIKSSAITQYNSKDVSYGIYLKATANNPALTLGVTPDSLPAFINVNVASQKDALDLYNQLVHTISIKTDKSSEELQKTKENVIYVDSEIHVMKSEFKSIVNVGLDLKSSDFFYNFKNFVQISGILIAIFLILVSLIIIFITTGMAIYSNREEIETMELVGATPGYIKRPYILGGAIFGALGAFISTAIMYILGYSIIKYNAGGVFLFLNQLFKGIEWVNLTRLLQVLLFLVLVLIGAIIGAIASAFATKRYLK